MSDIQTEQFNLKELVRGVQKNPVPDSCKEIAELLEGLPTKSWVSRQAPTPEQDKAIYLLQEKLQAPTAEEVRFAAEVASGRYHRIRQTETLSRVQPQLAKTLYEQYYEMTQCPEVKYILDNFDEFIELCHKSACNREYSDNLAPYKGTGLSTSRDPDSSEWKKDKK